LLNPYLKLPQEINRDGQDEQDENRTQKADLRFQIQNPKSKIQN
jgi:hypothetical protein